MALPPDALSLITMSDAEADRMEVRHFGLKAFTRMAWQVIEPSTPFIGNWHLDVMAEHLEAVWRCEINDLLINMPPRHMKSIEVAVMFPAWVWTLEPSLKWLYSSYAQSLSIRDSVKMRRLVESPWYRERWGDRFQLTSDQNQKMKFENDKTGYRMATGVGGSNTGEGGDIIVCLPYNSLIATDHGLIPIGRIVEEQLDVRVLSYDHEHGTSFQGIEAYEENPGAASVRLTFSNGLTIDGTNEHPVYVESLGYVPLSEVPLGSRVVAHRRSLRCLREAGSPGSFSYGANKDRTLLACLPRYLAEGLSQYAMERREGLAYLQAMWGELQRQAVHVAEAITQVLFREVSRASPSNFVAASPQFDDSLWSMWRDNQNYQAQCRQAEVLFSSMRQSRSSSVHRRNWQRALRAWSITRAILSGIQGDRTEDSPAGQASLLPLSYNEGSSGEAIGRASHRLRQDARRRNKPHHTLPTLSWGNARISGESEAMDRPIVVSCERISTPERVYNIRVARNHNYFANGILLHNCDDPHNVEERESDAMREGAIDWWSNVMSTRINNPKKRRRIVVMQRVHEHDLAGHLLEQGGWHHLNLPAEYEGGKCIVTGCVFHWDKDPRTVEGEPLWKERYGKAEIQQLKRDLKEFGAAAQLQQRPAPAEGGILKRHWWRYWCHPGQEETLPPVRVKLPSGEYQEIKPVPLPYSFDKEVQSWDMAFKDLATSSYVVGEQWGLKGPNCFLKDQVREQMDFTQTLESVRAFNRTHKQPSEKVVEDKANGPAIMSVLKKEIAGMQPHGVQGDKQARAAAYAHIVSAGNCYLPHPAIAPWVDGFIAECATFPNSEFDDQVDTWSQAMDTLYAVDDPGVAITPEYSAQFHQARQALEPVPGLPSFRFWYQGLYPCCIIGQTLSSGRIILLDCLLGDQNGGIEELIDRKVSTVLAADYRGCTDWRDITNHGPLNKLSESSEHQLDHIIHNKLQGSPEPGEPDFFTRLNAIKGLLSQTGRLTVNPAPTPGEAKPWIHEALAGGYAFRKDQSGVISKTEARKFHPLTSVGEALGHGLARIFVRKPIIAPKFNKQEATKRAKSYAV